MVWKIYRQVRELVTFFINQGHFEESKRILTHFLFPHGYIRKRGGKSRTKLEIGVTGKQNKTKNPKATPPALTPIWAVTRAPQGQSSEGYKPENAIFRQSKGGKSRRCEKKLHWPQNARFLRSFLGFLGSRIC